MLANCDASPWPNRLYERTRPGGKFYAHLCPNRGRRVTKRARPSRPGPKRLVDARRCLQKFAKQFRFSVFLVIKGVLSDAVILSWAFGCVVGSRGIPVRTEEARGSRRKAACLAHASICR